ncbi:nucleotide-diphospho-sugar transferase [Clavulina sp. PMI_390]|nr:nucleotide-diphospho-sugar transferase [Clavulina sp. PMI_390]
MLVSAPSLRILVAVCASSLTLVFVSYEFDLLSIPFRSTSSSRVSQPVTVGVNAPPGSAAGSNDLSTAHDIPYNGEYDAAVIYLAQLSRLDSLVQSLSLMQQNIPWKRQWPIILFHTGDYDEVEEQQRLFDYMLDYPWSRGGALEVQKRIEFIRLDLSFPPGVSPDICVYKPEIFEDRWPGYHQMCHFFAQNIFYHPRITNLKYYMRLDTDSYILEPLCFDPIDRLRTTNRVYAWNERRDDAWWVTLGMWNFIDVYARRHPAVEQRLTKNAWPWPEGRDQWLKKEITYEGKGTIGVPGYMNNFEVVKIEAFKRPDVVEFIDEIMKDPGRIYSLRWGDGPIRATAVSMFFDLETEVQEVCEMEYWHQGRRKATCECIPDE